MKILMTGSAGLMGSEIQKVDPEIIATDVAELDITNKDQVIEVLQKEKPDVVIHLAAFTQPPEHEKNPEPGLEINIKGTANIVLGCHQIGAKLVYTSTDYLYTGPGPHKEDEAILTPYKFGWSKVGGECAVRMIDNHLILRLSFGPIPFPWEKVYEDQFNSKLYVDEMAPLIVQAAKSEATGVMNLGGPRNSLEDYAKRTRSDIETIPRPERVPQDTSLDISKMKKFLEIDDETKLFKH